MIKLLFAFGSEKILISVNGTEIYFSSTSFGATKAPIDGINISKEGVIREFPDLKEDKDWKCKAIGRFKNHIESLKTEKERVDYIIKDLKKFGYILEQKQKEGFRPIKVKQKS